MEEQKKKKYSPEAALLKIQSWCAYQERSQQEARDKLYEYGLWPEAVESIIADLITQNFLNEERFAIAFTGGKFRIKKWGRVKIKIALKQKRVSDYCIKKALQEIDEDEYMKTLEQVIAKKSRELQEKNPIKRKYKLLQYAYSRGFEQDLILDVMKDSEE
ncbi:MAG TPA: regulatory protein RecX [Bacteroidia bacterium]